MKVSTVSLARSSPLSRLLDSIESQKIIPHHRRNDLSTRSRLLSRHGLYKVDSATSIPFCTASPGIGCSLLQLQRRCKRHGYVLPQYPSQEPDDSIITKTHSEVCDDRDSQEPVVCPQHALGFHDRSDDTTVEEPLLDQPSPREEKCRENHDADDEDLESEMGMSFISDPFSDDGDFTFDDIDDALSNEIDWNDLLFSVSPVIPNNLVPYRQRRVHFAQNLMSIVEIPSHRSYTDDEKAEIWTSSEMLRAQAYRNYAEWLWEGCSIDKVVEEDSFRRDNEGNLLHPAHCASDGSSPLPPTDVK